MKATSQTETVANYLLILISSFVLGYSLATYFIFEKEVPPVLVIAAALIFYKSMRYARKNKQ